MTVSYTTDFHRMNQSNALDAARIIVPMLIDLIHPSSVVDVGCGSGAWLSVFKGHGVGKVHGYDSHDEQLLIAPDEFTNTDLSKELTINQAYDLAMSLEVAEHLPKSRAASFVASLCSLAPVVMFSAAFPGQGGTGHVNEQWHCYWEKMFAAHNYHALDPIRPLIWYDERVAWYYRSNILLFASEESLQSNPQLRSLTDAYESNPLTLAHKRLFREGFIRYSLHRMIARLRNR